MAQPVRKTRQRSAAGERSDKGRRFTFSLSGAAMAALAVVLVTAVGWSFFMGFMVGRGQNPEKRVEQMTGMGREEAPVATLPDSLDATGAQPRPSSQNPPEAALPMDRSMAQDMSRNAAPNTMPSSPAAQAAPAPGADTQPGSKATSPDQPVQAGQTAQAAYPFNRPQGEGLAAWGIPQPAQADQSQSPVQGGAQKQIRTERAQPAPRQVEQAQTVPLFDYVFQTAAFKDKADADRLRARLEGLGLRTAQKKSGKVLLVLVNLRGTELDAANLREELKRMKLGAPILASKKPVTGKSRKTGR